MSILSENVRLSVCAKPKGLLLALTDLRSAQIGSAPGRTVEMRWPLKVPPCTPLPPGIHYSWLGSPNSGPDGGFVWILPRTLHLMKLLSFLPFLKARLTGGLRDELPMPTCRMDTGRALSKLPFTSRSGMGAQCRAPAGTRPAKGRQLSQDSSWLQLTECTQGRWCI